jgi:hypothetical protein
MTEALAASGAFGYVVLALGAIGVLVNLAMAGLAFTKRRVPLTALVAAPLFALTFGALGVWLKAGEWWEKVDAATGSDVAKLAFAGSYDSLWVDWCARWAAAAALAFGVWAAAVGSLVPGEEGKLTPAAAAGAVATTVVGAIAGLLWSSQYDWIGLPVVLLGVFVGLGVSMAATRRAADEEMFRVAGMRFAAGVCAVLAVWNAAHALDVGNQISEFTTGQLSTLTDMNTALEAYSTDLNPASGLGIITLFFTVVVAGIAIFAELGEVVERYTMFDMLGVVAISILGAIFRVLAIGRTSALFSVGTNEPALLAYKDITNGLAQTQLAEGEQVSVLPPAVGGFGDVFERLPAGEGKYDWFRTSRWTGRGWVDEVGTPLADAKISTRPPLLVLEGSQQAKEMLPVLEKAGGKGYVLVRASEAKAGMILPPEIARLEVGFFPVEIGKERDLKTQLWMENGALEMMWGPTTWYGEGDDAEPIPYVQAVIKSTGATGLNVSIGERRVTDVVNSCLPFLFDKGEDNTWKLSDRWCHITTDDMETLRAEAATAWPMPTADNVVMTLAIAGPIDAADVTDRVGRELGALSNCVDKAVKANEPVAGEMLMQLAIDRNGTAFDTRLDETSKVQSPTMLKCAAKRFRGIVFKVPPPESLPPPPPPDPKHPVDPNAPPPPPPAPDVKITLQITAPEPVPVPPEGTPGATPPTAPPG